MESNYDKVRRARFKWNIVDVLNSIGPFGRYEHWTAPEYYQMAQENFQMEQEKQTKGVNLERRRECLRKLLMQEKQQHDEELKSEYNEQVIRLTIVRPGLFSRYKSQAICSSTTVYTVILACWTIEGWRTWGKVREVKKLIFVPIRTIAGQMPENFHRHVEKYSGNMQKNWRGASSISARVWLVQTMAIWTMRWHLAGDKIRSHRNGENELAR